MTFRVLDENVLIVANDISRLLRGAEALCPEADDDCRMAALELLEQCTTEKLKILIDDRGDVVDLYRRRMSGSGQPGSGDAVFRYIIENQYSGRGVVRVALAVEEDGSFSDYPSSEELKDFDPSDRLFVALSVAGPKPNRIVNCVDSDWSEARGPLSASGVEVEELCPQCIRARG